MSSLLPGFETGASAHPRDVFYTLEGMITIGIVVDGDQSIDGSSPTQAYDLRAGWLMGRVDASGRWTPCKRTQTRPPTTGESANSSQLSRWSKRLRSG